MNSGVELPVDGGQWKKSKWVRFYNQNMSGSVGLQSISSPRSPSPRPSSRKRTGKKPCQSGWRRNSSTGRCRKSNKEKRTKTTRTVKVTETKSPLSPISSSTRIAIAKKNLFAFDGGYPGRNNEDHSHPLTKKWTADDWEMFEDIAASFGGDPDSDSDWADFLREAFRGKTPSGTANQNGGGRRRHRVRSHSMASAKRHRRRRRR